MRRRLLLGLLAAITALAWVGGGADAQTGVVIDEVMARNTATLTDADGDTPDWIELANNNGAPVQLAGWTVADDSVSWPIPTVTIPANGRLVIFASDKNRTSPDLHTNFKLSSAGETITLRNGSGTVIDQLGYGGLGADESWGRAPTGLVGPLLSPTPGQPNAGAQPPAVTATRSQTFFGSISVVLSTDRPAAIHFTLDGTAPTAASPRYTAPLTLTATTALRAAAVETGRPATGPESMEVYTRIDSRLIDRTSNLPIVVVTTQGADLGNTTPMAVSITEPGGAADRTVLAGPATTVSLGSARIRGLSSADFPKKQYRVELWDGWDTQNDTDVDLIGMGAESDWVLYAPGRFDRAQVQNPLMQRLHGDLGLASLETRFVEVYLDDNGDGITGLGEYEGLFVLIESIKVADERIDVGGDGYVFAIDWFDSCCADLQVSPAFSQLKIVDPGIEELTAAQTEAAAEWFNAFDRARDLPFAAPGGVTEFIDVQSFIRTSLLQVLSGNIDRYRASNYMYIDDLAAGSLLTAGPGWDFDRSLNSDDERDDLCASVDGPAADAFTWWWWGDLWAMPEYQTQLRTLWPELRNDQLRTDVLWQTIDALGAEIAEAWERDNSRWESTDGYGSRHGGLAFELEATKGWLACRLDFMDALLAVPTCFGRTVTVDIGAGQVPTPGNDVIIGTAAADVIGGGDGDDIICGGGGDDQLFGQNGDDLIFGGAGNDKLRGGDGDDELRGGHGADDANGGRDNDRVFGGPDADTAVRGGTGDDLVDGGAGNDLLVAGNGGADVVTGGPGDDRLVTGGPRPDVVRGGDGNDLVRGLGGADILLGDQGDDDLRGGRQPDTIDGGPGNDICNGGTTGDGVIESDTALPTCEGSPINVP